MSFPKYPKYKPSGVDWLGDVPEHWEVKRFKYIFKEREERSADGSELLLSVSAYTGVSPRSEVIDEGDHLSRAESLEGYKVCRKDDLVMNIMLAWNRGLAFTNYDGIVSPAYCVFDVINGSSPKFLDYLVRSNEYTLYYKAFSSGVIDSRLRLYPDTFGSLSCGLPPLPEQTQITAFLDRETAKIDALVAEQRRLIELLKEKRQAVISHAVTRGLNPSAPLKPSGIDWLGDVPAHWSALSIRRCCEQVLTGGTPAEYPPEHDLIDGMVWFTPGDFGNSLQLLDSERKIPIAAVSTGEAKIFPAGSVLVVSIGATLGKIGFARSESSANQQINAIIPKRLLDGHFLTYSLSTKTDVMRFLSNASTIGIMNQEKTKEIVIAVPPVAEQTAIVYHLDAETAKFDALTAEAERAISLLQERRTALISAAVTGQIDVRTIY